MTDIVKRLRSPTYPGWQDERADISRGDAHEAATEIGRLRAENENLRMDFKILKEEYRELKATMRGGQE